MAETETESKGRGGPRGPRVYKDKPTTRERVMMDSLVKAIKRETTRDVSPETARAVVWAFRRWVNSDETTQLRNDMDAKLKRAKLQERREKALAMLREADAELGDLPESVDEDEDEDEDEDDETDYSATDSDEDEDDEDDVFSDDKESVSSSF